MAIAIVAFAFVALMALIPAGLTTFRRSIDTAVCAQISQRIFNDAQQTDFDTLIDQANLEQSIVLEGFTFRAPKLLAPSLRYFDDQGTEVVPVNPPSLSAVEKAHIIYYVNTRIMPRTPLPKTAGSAAGTNGSPHPEALAQITIQVAHNPGHIVLPLSTAKPDDKNSPTRNLFDTKNSSMRGIEVLTYCAHVGRNL
jgi:uncharacterized protein (TIGR02598 family)